MKPVLSAIVLLLLADGANAASARPARITQAEAVVLARAEADKRNIATKDFSVTVADDGPSWSIAFRRPPAPPGQHAIGNEGLHMTVDKRSRRVVVFPMGE